MPRMLAASNRRLGSPLSEEDLRDLAQDTALRVWRKLPTFSGRAALETWLYRFCYLELMNAVRRRARAPRQVDEEELPEPSSAAPEPTGDAEERLARLLRPLSPRELEVVRLRHLEPLGSLREVAEVTGLSLSSVKTHYYRALEKLRKGRGKAD